MPTPLSIIMRKKKIDVKKYAEAKRYWNNVVAAEVIYEPKAATGIKEIDESIAWLAQSKGPILDFGCGNGRLLFASLLSGASSITGIDIASRAVNIADAVAVTHHLEDKSRFITGGIDELGSLTPHSFDGAILSNIIDNLYPEDAAALVRYMNNLLTPGARLLVKLNPFLEKTHIDNHPEYRLMSENFYKESSGLFLYNISDALLVSMLKTFTLEAQRLVHFTQYNVSNRLFHFTKD